MIGSPTPRRSRQLHAGLAAAVTALLIFTAGPGVASAASPTPGSTDAGAPAPEPATPSASPPPPVESTPPAPVPESPNPDDPRATPSATPPVPGSPDVPTPGDPVPGAPLPEDPLPEDPLPEDPLPGDPAAPDDAPPGDQPSVDARLVPARIAATLPPASRLSGPTAVDQAAAISRALYPGGADVVVVAATTASDAHIAAFVAGSVGAPVLYAGSGSVPAATAREIARLSPTRIVVVGSSAAVSTAAESALARTAPVERIDGDNVYGLSQNALRAVGDATTVYAADGATMIHAPAGVAVAGATDRGFLAINGRRASAPPGTLNTLRAVGAREVVLVGGTSSIGAGFVSSLRAEGFTVRRLAGSSRTAVSLAAAAEYPAGSTRTVLASASAPGHVTATAAAIAGLTRQPFSYAQLECVFDSVAAEMARRKDTPLVIGSPTALRAQVAAGDSCTTVRTAGERALLRDLRAAQARHPGSSYTVTVRQIGGLGEVVSSGGSTRREPASMMKLFVAWASFERIERGQASLKTKLSSGLTVEQCLRELIWMSDNYCHTDLVHWIGLSKLNREIAAAGFSRTAYGSVLRGQDVLYGGNRTTTNDLTLLLTRLDSGALLNKKHTSHLRGLMNDQLFRSRIPNGLPASAYQASKPGSLWVSGGLLQADSAIVAGGRGRYVISVIGDAGATKAGIRDISRAVYSHFNGAFGKAITHSDLHVRTTTATPWRRSPGGAIAGSIPPGTPLQVSDSRRHWYKVHYRGGYAWIWYSKVRSNLS
ncbi:serine hydrolase [Microbacterium sp. Ld14]|uniref:serine hydrolase n=1 Tax=Microbacterium sp. Ld14 TaxID=649156 RepID=UPI0038693188